MTDLTNTRATPASAGPALVFVEHVVWSPGHEWRAALEHVAARFERSSPLDADAVLERVDHSGAPDLVAQLDALDAWAAGAGADVDRELGRWLDEHLSMHVRPDATRTRAVRALAATRGVHAASALPPRAAESLARHAGAWRSFASLVAPVRSAEQLDDARRELGATLLVAAAPTPLPLSSPGGVEVRDRLSQPLAT